VTVTSENGFGPLLNGDGALPTSREQIVDLIRHLRQAADRLPTERTPREDL
jgi:hypothetical protein